MLDIAWRGGRAAQSPTSCPIDRDGEREVSTRTAVTRRPHCSTDFTEQRFQTRSIPRSQDGAARVGEEAAGELREGDDEASEPAEHLEPGPGAGQESQEAGGAGGRRTGPVQVSRHHFHMLYHPVLSLGELYDPLQFLSSSTLMPLAGLCLPYSPLPSQLYKLGGELGKGGFGVVYAAVRRSDKLQVNGKTVSKLNLSYRSF